MNRTLEWVLAAVMVITVLAFGGVQPFASSFMEIALFGAMLAFMIHQTWQGKLELKLPVWPLLFVLWIAFELVPLPAALVRALEPARFRGPPVHLAAASWLTLSIYPHDTLLIGLRILAYLAAFILAAQLFDSRERKSLLVRTLIAIGVFEAVYGSVELLTGWQKIFTYTKQAYEDSATGTYINRNHFAGLLEMTLPFLVGSVFYYFRIWQENRKGFARRASEGSAGFKALASMFLMIIIFAGLIFSRSRGGILSAVLSLFIIAMLAQLRIRRKTWLLGLGAFLIVAVGYGLWIGLGPVLERFGKLSGGTQDFDIATRLSFSHDALGMIRDYPWAGTGLGTFGTAFRHYQAHFVTALVDHVHDDYVEFAAETGVLGAALLFLPILYLLVRMVITFLTDRRRYRPAVLLGCIGAVLGLMMHSVMDFNLQIPANALIFAVVLGIGYKAACVERRDDQPEPARARPAARVVAARPVRRAVGA